MQPREQAEKHELRYSRLVFRESERAFRPATKKLLVLILALTFLAGPLPPTQTVIGAGGLEVAHLKDQLSAGLRARLPSEHQFIQRVTAMVEANELPMELVMSTFLWARRKRPYPFPYFERGLRTRAAKQGIQI